MNNTLWMINTEGGSKQVALLQVEHFKAKGWVIIPPDKLDQYGRPKQIYWPQYDKNNPGREKRITGVSETEPQNILQVEVF